MLIQGRNGFDARVLSYFPGILFLPNYLLPRNVFHIITPSIIVSDFPSFSSFLPISRFVFLLKFNLYFRSFMILPRILYNTRFSLLEFILYLAHRLYTLDTEIGLFPFLF